MKKRDSYKVVESIHAYKSPFLLAFNLSLVCFWWKITARVGCAGEAVQT